MFLVTKRNGKYNDTLVILSKKLAFLNMPESQVICELANVHPIFIGLVKCEVRFAFD